MATIRKHIGQPACGVATTHQTNPGLSLSYPETLGVEDNFCEKNLRLDSPRTSKVNPCLGGQHRSLSQRK